MNPNQPESGVMPGRKGTTLEAEGKKAPAQAEATVTADQARREAVKSRPENAREVAEQAPGSRDADSISSPSSDRPSHSEEKGNMDMLMDVEVVVTAELGRASMTIGEVTQLSAGSIVTLNKAAGETVDLRVNEKRFASGEVIIVDGYFAVKITKLLSKEDRVKSLS